MRETGVFRVEISAAGEISFPDYKIEVPQSLVGRYWGWVEDYAGMEDDSDYYGPVLVEIGSDGAIVAEVSTPKGNYAFSAPSFDAVKTIKSGREDVFFGAYNVALQNAAGDMLNLSFDSSATWDAGDPFDGDFRPKGGKKWHVNGEQRITSWVDDEEAKNALREYVGTYNLKAIFDRDDELGCWDLECVDHASDLKLVVDAGGMAHLTGTLDGAPIDQVSYLFGGSGEDWGIWLDYAFVHKGKSIYFELHLAPVALHEIYSGWCGYVLFK